MRYDVYVYLSLRSSSAEIETWIDAADPLDAAQTVMQRCGLDSAYCVFVFDGSTLVGRFVRLEVPAPSVSTSLLLSYDYDS